MMAALPLSPSQRGRTLSEPLQMRQVVTVLPRTGRLKGRNTIPTCRDLAGVAQWATLRCRFQVSLTDGHMHAATDQTRNTRAPFALSDL